MGGNEGEGKNRKMGGEGDLSCQFSNAIPFVLKNNFHVWSDSLRGLEKRKHQQQMTFSNYSMYIFAVTTTIYCKRHGEFKKQKRAWVRGSRSETGLGTDSIDSNESCKMNPS